MWAVHVSYEGDCYEADVRSTEAAAERYARLWRSRGFDARVVDIRLTGPLAASPAPDGRQSEAASVSRVDFNNCSGR